MTNRRFSWLRSVCRSARRAVNLANYRIVTLGGPGRGGSLKGHVTRVRKAVYDPVTNTVTLHMAQRMDIHNRYRITITGTAPYGLMGSDDALLAGAGTGDPGTNFVGLISEKTLVGPSSAAIRLSRSSQARPAGDFRPRQAIQEYPPA